MIEYRFAEGKYDRLPALIDRAGVVRRAHIETPIDNLSRYGIFATDDELLAAVRAAGL